MDTSSVILGKLPPTYFFVHLLLISNNFEKILLFLPKYFQTDFIKLYLIHEDCFCRLLISSYEASRREEDKRVRRVCDTITLSTAAQQCTQHIVDTALPLTRKPVVNVQSQIIHLRSHHLVKRNEHLRFAKLN